MFGISGEHLLVLGIILLIFGPKRLPELGNTLGKAMKNFKDSVAGVEDAKYRKIENQEDRAEVIVDGPIPAAQANSAQTRSAPPPSAV